MESLRDDDPKEIGGFALVCRIGSGGMGQVFLGESAAGHQAAVKVIKPSVLDEDTRARFLSEVESLRTVYGSSSSCRISVARRPVRGEPAAGPRARAGSVRDGQCGGLAPRRTRPAHLARGPEPAQLTRAHQPPCSVRER